MDFIVKQIIVIIRGKHNQAKNHKIDSLLWEKYQRP